MFEFSFINSLKNKNVYTHVYTYRFPFIIPISDIVQIMVTDSSTSKCVYSFLARNKQLT